MADERSHISLLRSLQRKDGAEEWSAYKAKQRDIDLTRVDLSDKDLRGYNLARVNLTSAKLFNTDLSGADLSHANLAFADLHRSNLANAFLTSANSRLWTPSISLTIEKASPC